MTITDSDRSGIMLRRAAVALAVSSALTLGYVVGVVRAHDVRLDEALLALQKAQGLVEAAQTDPVPTPVQNAFDRHRQNALRHIEKAMEQIVLAGDAVDNP